MSYIALISDDRIKERVAWKYNKPDIDARINKILRNLEDWGYVHCPKPSDAHLPYAGYSTKPKNHWKWFVKKKGLTLEKIEKLLEKE